MARYAALVVAPAALLLSPTCLALVDTTSVSTAGVSATVLAEPFGFAAGGYVGFEVELAGRYVPVSRLLLCQLLSGVWALCSLFEDGFRCVPMIRSIMHSAPNQ